MEIRRLGPGDYEAIIEVWTEAGLPFKPKGRDSKQAMEKEFRAHPDLILGAFINGELVGVIVGSEDGRKGWINRLAVSPSHRRRGIAKALIAACEEALRERGLLIICILVEDQNRESMRLFSEAGYIKHDDIHYLSKRQGEHV